MPTFTNSHPDAEAFLARVLARPDDRLTRLVFADWLDETGRGANAAWAEYIRLRAHLAEGPDPAGEARAEEVGWNVRATWTLRGLPTDEQLQWLTELLPDRRIRVRIGGAVIPGPVHQEVPTAVARERLVMPIAVRHGTVYAVGGSPDPDGTRVMLRWILRRDVVLFGGDPEDVRRAISRHYGPAGTAAIGCVFYELPPRHDPN